MSKINSTFRKDGMLFIGNRIHPDEKAVINARLARGLSIGIGYLMPHPSSFGIPSTRKAPYRREYHASIAERLSGKAQVVDRLAELSTAGAEAASQVPSTGVEALEKHLQDRRVDLIHTLGEMSAQASAA